MKLAVIAVLAALTLAVPAAARADGDEVPEIVVEVGQTVATEVGYAMGSFCDDTTVVRAEMQNGTPENNRFVVTGLKAGSTLCRVGTVIVDLRPTMLYRVTVVDAPPAAPAKPPKRKRR